MAIRQAFGLLAGLGMFVLSGPAMSATLNFTNYIDNIAGEKAVTANFSHATLGGYTISAHGSTVSNIFDPVPVGFNNYNTTPQAYFDRGGAGIGVCRVVVGTQCNPTNDDNVTGPGTPGGPREVLSVGFNAAVTVSSLILKAEGHNFRFGQNDKVNVSTDGIAWTAYKILNGTGMLFGSPVFSLLASQYIHLQFNNQQFYLAGATVVDKPGEVPSVPLPAAFPLLASGLGAAGLLGWRRKRKASTPAA